MAIIGKCFKLLFGHEPPTGRPPDPGGPGGGCHGPDCNCNVCDCPNYPPCTTGGFWACNISNNECTEVDAGPYTSQAACAEQCSIPDTTDCVCQILSTTVSEVTYEPPDGGESYKERTLIMVQRCKDSTFTAGLDIGSLVSQTFVNTVGDGWGDWIVGGPQPAPNQVCAEGSTTCDSGECDEITIVGISKQKDDDIIPGEYVCNWWTCVEGTGGTENSCIPQSALVLDSNACDIYLAGGNPTRHASLALCEKECLDPGDPPDTCKGFYCSPLGTGCTTRNECLSLTIPLGAFADCTAAMAANAPVLTAADDCGGNTLCCPHDRCWWTCDALFLGSGSSSEEDCKTCTQTINSGCIAPPSVHYPDIGNCVSQEPNCDNCIDRYLCDSKSTVNTGSHCGAHTVLNQGQNNTAGFPLNPTGKAACEQSCYNGYNCEQTTNTCNLADAYGATYAEPNAKTNCEQECVDGPLYWECPKAGGVTATECTKTSLTPGYASKELCEQDVSDCQHSWVCVLPAAICERELGDAGKVDEDTCISTGYFEGPCDLPTYHKCETGLGCIVDTAGTAFPNDPTCGNTCEKYACHEECIGGGTEPCCERDNQGTYYSKAACYADAGSECMQVPGGLPPNTDSDIKVTREVKITSENYLKDMKYPYTGSTISDPTISNRGYSPRGGFVPIKNGGNVRLDIFSNVIHSSLNYIFTFPKKYQHTAIEVAFDDLTISNLYLSLNNRTKKAVDTAYDSLGQPLLTQILERLRYLILTEQVEKFDLLGISELNNKKKDPIPKTLSNEAFALDEISRKGKKLSYKEYGGMHKERMKMWKTLAPDLDKAIPIVLADSTVTYIDINMDDSYTFTLSGGGTETRYINDGDYITFVTPTGELSYLELYSDIDKAKMLDIEDTTRIHKLLGDDHFFKFSVSSNETELVEETYSLTSPRPEKYILKLDPSTVEDLPRDKPIIRKSKATYSVITDEAEISSWILTKPWPYLTKYVDHQDPFLNHLESSNTMSVEFKDISFDQFYGYEDQFPVLPRRMPWYILVIPTDRTRLLLGNSISILTGYSSRELQFGYSPFTSETSQKWDPRLFNVAVGDRGQGILPFDTYDFPISLMYSPTKFSIYEFPYKKNTEPLPRKASPMKTFLTALSDAKTLGEDFVDPDDTIMPWGSIYKNIPMMEKKALSLLGGPNWGTIKGKIESNVFASESATKERYVKLSESPFLGIVSAEDFVTPTKKTRPTKVEIDPPADTPEEL